MIYYFLLGFSFLHSTDIKQVDECYLSPPSADQFRRRVEKIGDRKIEMELCIELSTSLASFKKVAKSPSRYSEWALKNINQKDSGDLYPLQLKSIEVPQSNVLALSYELKAPLVGGPGEGVYKITQQDQSSAFFQEWKLVRSEGLLDDMYGFMRAAPSQASPSRVTVHIKQTIFMASSFLYRWLPLGSFQKDGEERLKTLLNNFYTFQPEPRNP